jgi:peroxiredoxin
MKTILLTLICAAWALTGSAPRGYNVGDNATDFKLKNVDGKMVSLSDYNTSRGFIVVFDCNSCPYSKKYNGRIIALHKKYAALGFPLIAINSNDPAIEPRDSFQEMVKIAKQKGYDFPYLLDDTQSVAKTYGATNTPHVFVLVKSGSNLQVAYIGTIDDNAKDESAVTRKYVEDAVDAILSGKAVAVPKTKAIGCGIKWRNS